MIFTVNWLAIIVATVASMLLGVGWYMTLSKQWLAAIGKTQEQLDPSPAPYIIGTLCQLVTAYFIAVFTASIFEAVTLANAVQVGVLGWLGFIITSMILNHRYQNAKWSNTFIDGGYLLGVVIVQGIVIGLFG
jgi:Protein of unknown function (DUF1761)